MIQLQINSAIHLIAAYNQMMLEMRQTFEQNRSSDISMQNALDMARHQVVVIGEVSAEEAFELGEIIKRDINDAAEYMMETSAEFYDWLFLDIQLIERKVMALFLASAEQTRIELEQFKLDQASPDADRCL